MPTSKNSPLTLKPKSQTKGNVAQYPLHSYTYVTTPYLACFPETYIEIFNSLLLFLRQTQRFLNLDGYFQLFLEELFQIITHVLKRYERCKKRAVVSPKVSQ